MRVFAVILVLAVFSGSHGSILPLAEERSSWEIAADRFRDYFTGLNTKLENVAKEIKSSQIGRELDTLIQDTMAELTMYKDDVQNKLAPYAQSSAEMMGQDLQLLTDKLQDHMSEARDRMTQYSQELQTMMEQNIDDVRVRVTAYTRKLSKRLSKDKQEINKKVSVFIEELQSRASEQAESIRNRMEPYFAQVRDNAEAKITTFNDLLKDQAENMKYKMLDAAGNIRERFDDTTGSLRATLEEKVEAVRTWFAPWTSMITEKLGGQ